MGVDLGTLADPGRFGSTTHCLRFLDGRAVFFYCAAVHLHFGHHSLSYRANEMKMCCAAPCVYICTSAGLDIYDICPSPAVGDDIYG